MIPQLEDYARSVIHDRLDQAYRDALAAQLPHAPAQPFAASARVRLAHSLRSLAGRLDPSIVGEPRLLIARFR
jgi:hypothetical protein